MTENNHLLDETRSACLCDAGLPGYVAGVAVSPDGTEHFVLVERDSLGDGETVYDPAARTAVHEGLGRLPDAVLARIWAMGTSNIAFQDGKWARIYFCSGYNRKGRPCGIRVQRQGDRCAFHRERVSR
jgi:hypothetical protein